MFASRTQKDVTVEGVVVTLRKLSGRSLEKAREARSAAQLASLRGASREFLSFMRSPNEPDQSAHVAAAMREYEAQKSAEAMDPAAKRKARLDAYDRETVLNAGIVRWSVEDRVSPDSIADLEEDVAQTLHEAVLDLSLPPLDVAVAEAAEGKG